jgi:hypothetical protein
MSRPFMRRLRPVPPLADLLRRLIAGGSAALVLALSIFAASPVAHDWLHHHDGCTEHAADPRVDDGCAVVLFAGGVSLPNATPAVEPPAALLRSVPARPAVEVFLVVPRYLHQPERGPPRGFRCAKTQGFYAARTD